MNRVLAVAILATWLAGCHAGAGGSARSQGQQVDPAQRVAQVRAAGKTGTELEVAPLRDPQVEDLLQQAREHEQAGRVREADQALRRALEISPEAPDLLQWRAELALLGRHWDRAEQLAYRAWELGPRVGGLCRRHWNAIAQARLARGQEDAAGRARQQAEGCKVAPPVRM
ncbi:MAG TPA: hypothetical protein VK016_03775 [Arenimonas sp.]|jgi:tetratricopeptide (TPR) repeat protein|nr:hypothetical protein [Arenimonas sp.]